MEHSAFQDEQLIAVLDGEAGPELAEAVARASASDAGLRARIGALSSMLGLLGRAAGADADFGVARDRLDHLAAVTAPRAGAWAAAGAAVRSFVATLVLDSRRGDPALAGFRSGTGGRRLVFEADGLDISLRLEPVRPAIAGVSAGLVRLLGRVVGVSGPGRVVLSGAGAGPLSGDLDEAGFFELEAAPGAYTLDIVSGDVSVSLPEVEVTA
ncbi:MAG: hypothetical protein IT431_04345 [Phycisphaerales bacterium]|nr:hypothetical protein [Phycisphaerales bacterium]